MKRPGFFAVLSNSTMPLAGHSRPGFVMPYQFLQPYTTPLLDFFFFFFVSASSLFQKPNPSAQKYIYLHKKDLRQQVISKLSTLRGQNAHGILDCRCSSARCRRQGGCALLTSFVVLLWGYKGPLAQLISTVSFTAVLKQSPRNPAFSSLPPCSMLTMCTWWLANNLFLSCFFLSLSFYVIPRKMGGLIFIYLCLF